MSAKILPLSEVKSQVVSARAQGRRIALANGVFDLLHVGHLRYLEGARALADGLVVAVNSDASTRRLKGPGRPHIPETERAELVAGLACVDWVLLFDELDVRTVIRELRPDVQVKGTDYTPETIPEREEVLAYGGRVAVAGDPKTHSTTAISERLLGVPAWVAALLACPRCHGSLLQDSTGFVCEPCALRYAVEDGLPNLVLSDATPLGRRG